MIRGMISVFPRAAAIALLALAGCAGDTEPTVDDATRVRLAQALEASGNSATAATVLRTQNGTDASSARDPMTQAQQLVALGQPEQGVAVAKAALAERGDDPSFAIEVGRLAVRAGRLAEADEIYRTVLARHPDNVEALNGHGVVLAQKGDLAGAAGAFRRVLELRPTDVPARHNLDLIVALTGQGTHAP